MIAITVEVLIHLLPSWKWVGIVVKWVVRKRAPIPAAVEDGFLGDGKSRVSGAVPHTTDKASRLISSHVESFLFEILQSQ